MVGGRCSRALAPFTHNMAKYAAELLETLTPSTFFFAVNEFSAVVREDYLRRLTDLESALTAVSNSGGKPGENKVRALQTAYGALLSALLPDEASWRLLINKAGYSCKTRDGGFYDLEALHRRGWYRLVYKVVRAYLIAVAGYYESAFEHYFNTGDNGGNPAEFAPGYTLMTWTQLANFLKAEYDQLCPYEGSEDWLETYF